MASSRDEDGAQQPREVVSDLTTARLSVYLRCLADLEAANVQKVSSHELARRFHLNSAQIRKDLAHFGEFGIRGVGYDVKLLRERLRRTLGIDVERNLVIVGAGNLGMALADYRGFNSDGFRVVCIVDSDPGKVHRMSRSGACVRPYAELEEIIERERVEVGVIAVPAEAAQPVYDALTDAGIRAVLNFAPTQLRLREDAKVRSVDLRISLETLSFYLKQEDEGHEADSLGTPC